MLQKKHNIWKWTPRRAGRNEIIPKVIGPILRLQFEIVRFFKINIFTVYKNVYIVPGMFDTLTSLDISKIRWLFILDDDYDDPITLGILEYSETCLKRLFTGQTKVSILDQWYRLEIMIEPSIRRPL